MKKNIKIFIMDCDGVLTDAGMYYSDAGIELKKFNTRDGIAIKKLRENGIITGIITGENTKIVKKRAKKLKLDFLYLGIENKFFALEEICKKYNVSRENILYVGDDINDLEIMQNVGISCCPSDACPEVKQISTYICKSKGGYGVIREIVDNFMFENEVKKKDDLLNLFDIPNVQVIVPTKWLFENSMISKEIMFNAHLLLRYRTIEAFYSEDNKWWYYYNMMQQKRVAQKPIIPRDKANNEEKFKKLIKSIEKNGFKYEYPIIINRNFRLIDGSHRLVTALYFNIPFVSVKMNKNTIDMNPEYSLSWFKDNGFEEIIDEMVKTYEKIVEKGE